MIKIKAALTIVVMASLALSSVSFAADAKVYTGKGKITHASASEFTLRTAMQDIVVARDAKTKVVGGELRKGQSATVLYIKEAGRPVATEVTISGSATR